MRIVQPYATLQAIGLSRLDNVYVREGLAQVNPLAQIEAAARVSHRSEEDQTETSYERFVQAVVMKRGDMSVVEHVSATVELYVDRGVTHELVRHRLFSYTQESTRFVNYQKKMPPSFIYPDVGIECPECLGGNEPVYHYGPHERDSTGDNEDTPSAGWRHTDQARIPCNYDPTWLWAISTAEEKYRQLLGKRWPPQLARSVFPNALASKVIMTGNLRSWRHFLRMRTTKEAHPQMRQVTIPLLEQFQKTIPILYEDIKPEASQADNVRLPC